MSTATRHSPPTTRPTRRWRMDQQNEAYLFLLPSLAGFLIFVILPMLASILLSLGELKVERGLFLGWAGELLRNAQRCCLLADRAQYGLFYGDDCAAAIGLWADVGVGTQPASARACALSADLFYACGDDDCCGGHRVSTPAQPGFWANQRNLLEARLDSAQFSGRSRSQKPSVVLLTLWKNTGFTMVIYLAALQGVPQELYDAANVDGATAWQRFRNVTFPLISPTTFFLFVLQMIGAFQLFTEAYVMTRAAAVHPPRPR